MALLILIVENWVKKTQMSYEADDYPAKSEGWIFLYWVRKNPHVD
jgi:hypothetical protein